MSICNNQKEGRIKIHNNVTDIATNRRLYRVYLNFKHSFSKNIQPCRDAIDRVSIIASLQNNRHPNIASVAGGHSALLGTPCKR